MFSASIPLCYCTNVHPCRRGSDVERVLDEYTVPVRQRCGFDIGAGLWLPADALREVIVDSARMKAVRQALDARGLVCYTLNAFPYGDFHSERVKEQVYLPDWSDSTRLDYTTQCAELLAHLLPTGMDGSISTLPLASKLFRHGDDFYPIVIAHLIELANRFDRLATRAGQVIRLAIEPEPYCLLETTAETVEFFQRLWSVADDVGCGEVARRHLGVCYDVCHQAVEFENAADAIRSLQQADIRINKVQISCAIELEDASDAAARGALARFVEPRYLHQTMARAADGQVLRVPDLTTELTSHPNPDWLAATTWRTHFHVPVDAERIGILRTTRSELRRALAAIAQLDYAPHLEVETYTWPVMPGATPVSLVDGLARELIATRQLIQATA